MKPTNFVIVIIAALLFLLPIMMKERKMHERQAQEEAPKESEFSEQEIKTISISYRVPTPKEEPVADIIWIKRAADVAMNEGIPYFNIIERKVEKWYVREFNQELSVIDGIIELENDPMKAEYDSHEIQALILSDEEVE